MLSFVWAMGAYVALGWLFSPVLQAVVTRMALWAHGVMGVGGPEVQMLVRGVVIGGSLLTLIAGLAGLLPGTGGACSASTNRVLFRWLMIVVWGWIGGFLLSVAFFQFGMALLLYYFPDLSLYWYGGRPMMVGVGFLLFALPGVAGKLPGTGKVREEEGVTPMEDRPPV